MFIFVYSKTKVSMSEHKEIDVLLRNLQEGLKKYTLKELNDAIVEFLNSKKDKRKEIDLILEIVCEDFEISLNTLKQPQARGDRGEAKQLTYCLLYNNLGLSTRQISDTIFTGVWHSVIYRAIIRLRTAQPHIKSDKLFLERYQRLNEKFIDKLTQENKLEYEH
jgi:chromosomal replication initiation ATPase DnaA